MLVFGGGIFFSKQFCWHVGNRPQIEKTPHQLHQKIIWPNLWFLRHQRFLEPVINFARQSMVTKLFLNGHFVSVSPTVFFRHKQRVLFYTIIAMGWLAWLTGTWAAFPSRFWTKKSISLTNLLDVLKLDNTPFRLKRIPYSAVTSLICFFFPSQNISKSSVARMGSHRRWRLRFCQRKRLGDSTSFNKSSILTAPCWRATGLLWINPWVNEFSVTSICDKNFEEFFSFSFSWISRVSQIFLVCLSDHYPRVDQSPAENRALY